MSIKKYLSVFVATVLTSISHAQQKPQTPAPAPNPQQSAGQPIAPPAAATSKDLTIVPLSEGAKPQPMSGIKPIGVIEATRTSNQQVAPTTKKPKEFELVRTTLNLDNQHKKAIIKVNGVSAAVEVGSPVLKYYVSTIHSDHVCLSAVKSKKPSCSKQIKFEQTIE